VFGADVLVIEPFGLFGSIGENAFALVAKREIDAGGDLLADGGVRLNLLANRLDGGVGAEETIRQSLVFAQQSEQQVLSLDIGAAKLAGLIPGEEDNSAGLFSVAFKHSSIRCYQYKERTL